MFQIKLLIFLAVSKLMLAEEYVWPNGIVYYEIDSNSFYSYQQYVIKTEMRMIENQTRFNNKDCIKFKEHVNESHFVRLIGDAACQNADLKEISVDRCINTGKIGQELMNILGSYQYTPGRYGLDDYLIDIAENEKEDLNIEKIKNIYNCPEVRLESLTTMRSYKTTTSHFEEPLTTMSPFVDSKSDLIKPKVTLKHSWPMSHLNDVVGNAHLFGVSNYSFVPDRFENPNSAIHFNNVYLQQEHGTNMSGDFTVTLWLYLKSENSSANIFELGHDLLFDIAAFQFHEKKNACLFGGVWESRENGSLCIFETPAIQLNEWSHIALVLKENKEILIDSIDTRVKLTNYWPMKGMIYLWDNYRPYWPRKYGGLRFIPHLDRFGHKKSAFIVSDYLIIKPSIFLTGDLTVIFWFYLESYRNSVNILGLGIQDTVLLKIQNSKLIAGNGFSTINSSMEFEIGKWYHIAYVLQNTKGHIYVNGELNVSGELYGPKKLNREMSLLGGLNNRANLVLDDVAIYQGAMVSQEVLNDFNLSKTSFPSNSFRINPVIQPSKVQCNCPCKWGEVNGLSLTLEYKRQCLINNVFKIDNYFECYIEGSCQYSKLNLMQ